MRPVLADVPDLECCCRVEFGLGGEVPLLDEGGLNFLIPYVEDGACEGIAGNGAART